MLYLLLLLMGESLPPEPPAVKRFAEPPPIKRNTVSDYDGGIKTAKLARMPLVVFVGKPSRPIIGAVVAEAKQLVGFSSPSIVVSWFTSEGEHLGVSLPVNATDDEITITFRERKLRDVIRNFFNPACRDGNCPR